MFDLTTEAGRKDLARRISVDVDEACIAHFSEGFRKHMGASIIGDECSRVPWFGFRWVKKVKFSGKMYRLFDRGHKEEPRMIEWLEMAGFTFHSHNPETGDQYRIEGAGGHFGGSMDGFGIPPVRYELGNIHLLCEFKTSADKYFKPVVKNGMRKEMPKHYKQMCSYGKAYGFKYGLYAMVNKNTDELHYEIVELDYDEADDLYRKAENLVLSQNPPPKLNEYPTHFKCKMCDYAGVCHLGDLPVVNCRSCINATPIDNKRWQCALYGLIPDDEQVIMAACGDWTPIVNAN